MNWIKTTEKLPEDEQTVIICLWQQVQMATYYAPYDDLDIDDKGRFASEYIGLPALEISHWMPLPEPPNTEI